MNAVISQYYKTTKITSRTRTITFKNNSKWRYLSTFWTIGFSAKAFINLYKSLSPLPINYKEENLEFLFKRQSKSYNQRNHGETRKLIVKSLLERPKTMQELAKELLVKQTTIRAHIKGHPSFSKALMELGIAEKVDDLILRRGGFAKATIYGIKDRDKAKDFIKNI